VRKRASDFDAMANIISDQFNIKYVRAAHGGWHVKGRRCGEPRDRLKGVNEQMGTSGKKKEMVPESGER